LRKQKPKLDDMHQSGSEPVVSLAQVERNHIIKVYGLSGKNKAKTAKLIGIGINTLRRKLDSYGVN
jgi:DNA-binding NtrC family response regulator